MLLITVVGLLKYLQEDDFVGDMVRRWFVRCLEEGIFTEKRYIVTWLCSVERRCFLTRGVLVFGNAVPLTLVLFP